ncbi:MAG: sigH [Ferruginibacter sp.]|nr:sigH [Ferruginibacter sp.]
MSNERNLTITATIQQLSKRLLGFIKQRVNSHEDAEDILQDVFSQFAGNTETIEQAGSWLFKVARNKIIDNYRKQKLPLADDLFSNGDPSEDASLRMTDWKDIMMPDQRTPETEYLRNMFWDQLKLALDELPENQRDIFIQTEIEGYAFKDIAAGTGLPVQTLISRKRYAVLHLRERLNTLRKEILEY